MVLDGPYVIFAPIYSVTVVHFKLNLIIVDFSAAPDTLISTSMHVTVFGSPELALSTTLVRTSLNLSTHS